LVDGTDNGEDVVPEGRMRTPLTFLSIGDTNTPNGSPANALVAEGGEAQTIANGRTQSQRRLLVRDEVISLLQITAENVQQLINTRQLLAIRIAGEERFDSRDLDRLIETYKTTAARRP
jgi:hypothetical protein